MIFDNSKAIIRLRIRIFAATVLLLAYFILTYFAAIIKYPLLGLSETYWTIILLGLYFIYALYPMVLSYQYVSFSDEGDFLVFRFFNAGIVGGRKNSIEVDKRRFAGYKTERAYFGLKQSIVLYQQLREGVAKYPPVYISNLTKEEKAKVLNSLYLHTPQEMKEVKQEHE
jgi:hypothetical protein